MNVRVGCDTASDATWKVRPIDGWTVGDAVRLDEINQSTVGYTLAAGHGFKNSCRLDYREDGASSSSSELREQSREAAPAASPSFLRYKQLFGL